MLWLDIEGAPVVYLRHLIHEVDEVMPAGEHERVDRDALACAADDLAERRLERAFRRGIVELRIRAPRLEVRRWLAVGDEDDLLVLSARPREQGARGLERVLHVRAVDVLVPGEAGGGGRAGLSRGGGGNDEGQGRPPGRRAGGGG